MNLLSRVLIVAVVLLASGLAVGAGLAPQKANEALRADALRLRQKVAIIAERGASPRPEPLRTLVTEREVNAYLNHDPSADIPVGIAAPRLAIHDNRRVSGTAIVDLDAVRAQHKSTGVFDPMSYLVGKLPVSASGFLDARNGLARFELESAAVAGVPVPKMVLQELVSYYTRSPEFPKGINIDDPFPLPARIRQIQVRRGEALVVQ